MPKKIKKDREKDEKKSCLSAPISWYPGHMAKTKKQIIQDLKLIDIVIELLDARIPISSQNPNIAEITKNKKKIIVLNKCDLSDDKQNKLWIEYFKKKNIPAVLVDSNSGRGIDECIRQIEKIMQVDLEAHAEKGRTGRKIRAMILGIPNVGKSSLINALMNRKSYARISATPGKTQTINYYSINDEMYLVDLPGYGYAKVSEQEKIKWGQLIERYLHSSAQLKAVFLLIDIRHAPSENDRIMYQWIVDQGFHPIIIATKLDKIKRSQVQKQMKVLREGLKLIPGTTIIPFSSQTKQGRDEIWDMVENQFLNQ